MGLLEVAVVLAWASVLFCLWLIFQIVAQNGRLLIRVEALERQLGDLLGLTPAQNPVDAAAYGADVHDQLSDDEQAASQYGLPVGTVLHDFELPDLEGRQHLRSRWLGERLVMIFVSPYCRHSRALLSDLATVLAAPAPAWPTPLIVSTGSFDENRRLVGRLKLRCAYLIQEEMEVGDLFEVKATPMAYLVDEAGTTASVLAAGRVKILGLAVSSLGSQDDSLVESPSYEHLHAVTTPAPVSGERYQGGLGPGDLAPPFDLPGLDGETVTLDRLGGKPLLLAFVDPASEACDAVVPRLEQLHRDRSAPPVVLISRGGVEANRTWAARHGLTLPIGIQPRWDVSREYGLLAAPIAFHLDTARTIAAPVAVGADAIADLAASLAAADR